MYGCLAIIKSGENEGQLCGRETENNTGYCFQWNSHSRICGSERTATGNPCKKYATLKYFPYCCSKHDEKRPTQLNPQDLRIPYLRDHMLDDILLKTGSFDVYAKKPIEDTLIDSQVVEHVIELQTHRDALGALMNSQRKEMIPYVRNHVANDISNLVLTTEPVNISKFKAIYSCSEDYKTDSLNPAGLTHYLLQEFALHSSESKRKYTRNIKNEMIKSYDNQCKCLLSGENAHDAYEEKLQGLFVGFKIFS
ncbi:hypothetical protein HK100_008899 [Physocladia obscura]|uniref:Uncharacterized protein n=1 Tax=Physocladia obscura TaxID=109957 RepID=A0AAD5SQ24_9FUNG|nr:hypothetical protein HK100_008899 [Physocladia obscura]